jgi:hypothetical protein
MGRDRLTKYPRAIIHLSRNVLRPAYCIPQLAFDLIDLAFNFGFLVAGCLASPFLRFALCLFRGAFHPILGRPYYVSWLVRY